MPPGRRGLRVRQGYHRAVTPVNQTLVTLTLRYAYHQFSVYDDSLRAIGCDWTNEYVAQGFARRESVVSFATILDVGHADVTVGTVYQPRDEYERVIAVPFLVVSGPVVIKGPEESLAKPALTLPPGFYRLVAAQRVTLVRDDGFGDEQVDLFFEAQDGPVERSAILVADAALDPPFPLRETVGISGEP